MQIRDGPLEFHSNDLHQWVFENRISKGRSKFFFRDLLDDGRKGIVNGRSDALSNEMLQILMRHAPLQSDDRECITR